jgi:hypothetical protein
MSIPFTCPGFTPEETAPLASIEFFAGCADSRYCSLMGALGALVLEKDTDVTIGRSLLIGCKSLFVQSPHDFSPGDRGGSGHNVLSIIDPLLN